MYCSNCGREIDEKAAACPHCGVATRNGSNITDRGGFGWGFLGFWVPVVGLILYLIWKDDKPKTSKAAGIGALSGVCAYIGFFILYFLFLFVFMGGLFFSY